MRDLSAAVHSKEDYTSRYLVTERIDGGGADLCIFETYIPPPPPFSRTGRAALHLSVLLSVTLVVECDAC